MAINPYSDNDTQPTPNPYSDNDTQPISNPHQDDAIQSASQIQSQSPSPPQSKSRTKPIMGIIFIIIIVGVIIYYFSKISGGNIITNPISALITSKIDQPNVTLNKNFIAITKLSSASTNPLFSARNSLFANSTKGLVVLSSNSSPAVVYPLYISANKQQSLQLSQAWNSADPQTRCVVLGTLYQIGVIPLKSNTNLSQFSSMIQTQDIQNACSSEWSSIKSHFNVPLNTSNKVSLYELTFAAADAVSIATNLADLFQCKLFNNVSASDGQGSYYPINLSIGLFRGIVSAYYPTESTSPYASALASFQSGWLASIAGHNTPAFSSLLNGNNINCGNLGTLTPNQFFYALSFDQYAGIQFYEVLYNKSVAPAIAYVSYTNNTIIVNAGNINPSSSLSAFQVDGNNLNSTKYYNYFVAKKHLGVGNHTVTLNFGNYTLQKKLYINPFLVTSFSASHKGGGFTFKMINPSYANISISKTFVGPVTYANGTSSGYTSFPPFSISKGANKTLNANIVTCSRIGTPLEINITLNTTYGNAQYFAVTTCI